VDTPIFSGVGVALLTLFDDDLGVDPHATADLASQLVATGMRAVVVAGTTGEAVTLSPEERVRLIRAVRAALPVSVPVIAGTGAPSIYQAVRLSAQAADAGADAVLALSPRGQSDPRHYYEALVSAVSVPVLAYHYPSLSAPGIPVSALDELGVAACKDSSADATRFLAEMTDAHLPIYVGSGALLSFAGPLGATGAILALANAEPERCVAAFAGDATAQRQLAPSLLACDARFPGAIKSLTAQRFKTPCAARLD
jgi:4-hydroxy-tetrahydrodipicolinate synthase